MWLNIGCSRCGKTYRLSDNHPEKAVNMARAGWRNYGTALYCPKCSSTWHQRNSKPLGNEIDAVYRILVIMREAQKAEVYY